MSTEQPQLNVGQDQTSTNGHRPNGNAGTSSSEHHDAAYLKRDDIGLVIAKGLAVMYK